MTAPATIKLPDEPREGIAPLADAAGRMPHTWMVEALERQADLAEAREVFIQDPAASAA
ncbi:MAG: hypothetical protein ACM3O5_00475 [Betaproteobacteria bacterium]